MKKWLPYVPVVLYAIAWIWIFAASAQAGCDDNIGFAQTKGALCMARKFAGLSCFLIYFAVWTYLGMLVAKGKGRNPTIGLILGFTLQFMGCLLMMIWEPRKDLTGRMIGWDEYKHFTPEQREAIRPAKVPVTPEMRRRKQIVIGIAIVAALFFVFQILRNLGRI
jgi:hypothetical protein